MAQDNEIDPLTAVGNAERQVELVRFMENAEAQDGAGVASLSDVSADNEILEKLRLSADVLADLSATLLDTQLSSGPEADRSAGRRESVRLNLISE